MFHPHSMRTRGTDPLTFAPDVASAGPLVIAVHPDIAWSGGDADGAVVKWGGRSYPDNDLGRACRRYE